MFLSLVVSAGTSRTLARAKRIESSNDRSKRTGLCDLGQVVPFHNAIPRAAKGKGCKARKGCRHVSRREIAAIFSSAWRSNAFLYHFTIKESAVREAEVGLRGKRGRSFVENTPREG